MRRPYSVTSSFPPSCCVQGKAKGYLYTDDGLTLSHEKGVFLYRKFEFNNNQFISRCACVCVCVCVYVCVCVRERACVLASTYYVCIVLC